MKTGFWCETVAVVMLAGLACGQSSFINFETPPVHPLRISPDGQTLAVCNLPAGTVELFDLSQDIPVLIRSVAVGVDPVSVRFRNSNELWVVNHISASVNVVDVAKREVVAVCNTLAGPCDVLFAGSPQRAFVSCARENTVQVLDPDTRQVLTNLVIEGDRPKALAASPDGRRVYVAIFESGNASTVLVGVPQAREPLLHPDTPYHGQFPPPNDGSNLNPPLYMNPAVNPMLYSNGMPRSLIVKKNIVGRWMDDNHGDWTEFISGTNSTVGSWDVFGRPQGWDMPDRDLAIINTADYSITYAQGLMNICMDVAVNPASGTIAVIGTDATNERRFEPNLRGTFVRVNLALIDPLTLSKSVLDLNPHLDYSTPSLPRAMRDLSIGDPRGIVWNAAGARSYVIGMGSHNLVMTDAAGHRVMAQPIELDDGPAGLALDEAHQRLYVLNRFAATLSVLDTAGLTKLTNIALFDPTPTSIKLGRRHLYDTRKNSGLGHVSCASCHVDARFDRLAWDLGNPQADTLTEDHSDVIAFHPMKGPLVTQTLQDIIGHEPLHWRGAKALRTST
jgi:DNA-binding beta-propeller fold protein YncE